MATGESLLYLESFPTGTVWLSWKKDLKLYQLKADGEPVFLDRTFDYAQAVGWLCRLLSTHGRDHFAFLRAPQACALLGLELPPGPEKFHHP